MSIEAQAKSENLIAWFADKDQSKPIKLNDYTNIFDVKKYIECNAARLRKLPALSQQWRMCYYRLYNLKLKIQST